MPDNNYPEVQKRLATYPDLYAGPIPACEHCGLPQPYMGACLHAVHDGNRRVLQTEPDWPRTFEDVFAVIFDQAFDILVERQRDYGSRNVAEQGIWGIYSRVAFDKISRLGNLIGGKIENGKMTSWFEAEAGESIEDTCIDVMNYCSILIALKRGQWGLPLRGEQVKHG